jgi:hypothetical protein
MKGIEVFRLKRAKVSRPDMGNFYPYIRDLASIFGLYPARSIGR